MRGIGVGGTLRVAIGTGDDDGMDAADAVMLTHVEVDVQRSNDYEGISAEVQVLLPQEAASAYTSRAEPPSATRGVLHRSAHVDSISGEMYSVRLPSEALSILRSTSHLNPSLLLRCRVPERFCSVDVRCPTAGTSTAVRVDSITEAALTVHTGPHSSVTLGRIRGGSADIITGGGSLRASMIQANTVINTGGGSVSVKRLQGVTVDVDSGGGRIELGPTFVESASIVSRGGDIDIDSLRANVDASVIAAGGRVGTGLLDGNVRIDAGDGNIEVCVSDAATSIQCNSLSDISVACPRQSHMFMRCTSPGGVNFAEGMRFLAVDDVKAEDKPSHHPAAGSSDMRATLGTLLAEDPEGGWEGRLGVTEFGEDGSRRLRTVELRLNAGGAVELRRGSWLGSILKSKAVRV